MKIKTKKQRIKELESEVSFMQDRLDRKGDIIFWLKAILFFTFYISIIIIFIW